MLHFSGWTRLNRLPNGVTVWERPDVAPLPVLQPRRLLPASQAFMWGVIPPVAMGSAFLVLLINVTGLGFSCFQMDPRPHIASKTPFGHPRGVRAVVIALAIATIWLGTWFSIALSREWSKTPAPRDVVATYFDHLDFRRFDAAYDLMDPQTRPVFEDCLLYTSPSPRDS